MSKSNAETRSGYKSEAFDLQMDRLSLQMSAILKLVRIDRRKALSLLKITDAQFGPLVETYSRALENVAYEHIPKIAYDDAPRKIDRPARFYPW